MSRQDKNKERKKMEPTIGRIVHYRLSDQDIDKIKTIETKSDLNPHTVGQVVPMVIVVVWPNEYGPNHHGVNGHVLLDGAHSLWVTSAEEGIKYGKWSWPEIKK